MERLTTNKDKSEMGMYELAHNSCYCKDGLSRYRDFESDIDARELTRHLLKNFADGDDAFVDDDDFDEEMLELLQFGTETIEGLIALFYRNLWGMADLREKLKEYEDLDEQGLLLRLPCKVGDTVYSIANDGKIYPVKATREVRIVNGVLHIICESCRYSDLVSYDDVGKTVFLTQEEAEQKLKEKESD